MSSKCVCGHDSHHHELGSLEKFNKSFLTVNPIENRIHCKICECPKFKKKHFWSNSEPYEMREK